MTVSLASRCYQDGKSRVCRSLFAQAINHFAKCLQHAMRARGVRRAQPAEFYFPSSQQPDARQSGIQRVE